MRSIEPTVISLAAPPDIEGLAHRLAAMRQTFLATGATGTVQPRSLIHASWRRCRDLAVDAERNLAQFGAACDQQVAELRAQNEGLLLAAFPVLARLSATLADVGYVVALGDAEGNLLEVGGNYERRRELARKGLLPGSNWSEASAGTNAIGTALATGRVVQLLAAEHYCEGWQDVTCTAAPIRHPASGALLGVLDITGDYRLARPFLGGLLAVAALEVQRGLAIERSQQRPQASFAGVAVPGFVAAAQAQGEGRGENGVADTATATAARRLDVAERLAAATGAISASLDLGLTLERVATQFGRALGAAGAGVTLLEGAEEAVARIWHEEGRGDDAMGQAVAALLDGAPSWSACGKPSLFDARAAMPPELAASLAPAGVEAVAIWPLRTARGALGVVAVARREPGPWGAGEGELGQALAAHAATALEHARLHTALRAYASHTETLNVLATFLSSLLDPGQHLELVLRHIAELTDLDAGLVFLHDGSEAPLLPAAAYGLAVEGQGVVVSPSLARLVEAVAHTGQALLLCRQHEAEQEADVLQATGVCDLVALPLAQNGASLGVLVVGSRRHRQVSREELILFQTIAQQLSLALSNARLRRAASENEALREADRLKSAFLAMVSHELRSPLTAIRASVEGLLDRAPSGAPRETDGLLQNIACQAGRLGRFVDQLLDLSCIEAGRLAIDREWVEVAALLDDVLISFRRRSPDCRLEPAFSPDLPLLYLDPALAGQILWNLLENAQKYGPPAGPIRVEAFCTGGEVLISVADRGPGVDPLERGRIFGQFVRLDRDRRAQIPGSGLGLAICRGVAEAHGGRIWVDERPGGGSIFRVALPVTSSDLAGMHGPELPPGMVAR